MIALIVLNWNNYSLTIDCIKSVIKAKIVPDIIVIVDNGSNNHDYIKLKEGVQDLKESRIKVIKSYVNLGFGVGNNLGIDYAISNGADIIWLLNNDTIVTELALLSMKSKMDEDPGYGMVGCSLVYDYDRKTTQALGGGNFNVLLGQSKHITQYEMISEINYLTAASVIIKVDVIKAIGAFNPRIFLYWEDVELSLRVQKAGWKLAVARDAIVYHKESASSKNLGNQRQAMFTEGLFIVLSHFHPQRLFAAFLINFIRGVRKLALGDFAEGYTILRFLLKKAFNNKEYL
ncbi:glycosyltransferase family 2 protein [Deinococcus petrolearius]|uniref:Glycosyltransferase family 2 protein n=1 Tax=Deinococcus petrolearius TaxID=1751295 RepID=A0ABW1DHM5_9DEIO